MKKPMIRVTKWLGDIPVEAACSVCPCVAFRTNGSSPRQTPVVALRIQPICGFETLIRRYHVCDWRRKLNSRARDGGVKNVDRQMARDRNFPKKCSRRTDLRDRRI